MELYKAYGNTGQKYHTKYRSLLFNIKDAKNETLWRKICEKKIAPSRLVQLSSDELASQELSSWRERETKHQLEIIKRSEIEALNTKQSFFLKSHRGEELMEVVKPKSTVDSIEIDDGSIVAVDNVSRKNFKVFFKFDFSNCNFFIFNRSCKLIVICMLFLGSDNIDY